MMGNLNYSTVNPDYLFYTLEKKIDLGVFKTKEDLLNEINRLNEFYKKNGNDLSIYSEKIEKLLKKFDEKNNSSLDFSALKEHTLDNGQEEATMKINGENVTIINENANKSIKEEISDLNNKNLAQNLNNANNTLEDSFNSLKKFTHNEDRMTSFGNIDSAPDMKDVSEKTNILKKYAETNHIVNPEFSRDGKMRDEDGNVYEVIYFADGSSKINITASKSYNGNVETNESAKTVSEYSKEETMEKASLNQNGSILSLTEFITYLAENYENIDEILKNYNIDENQKEVYKNLAYEEYLKMEEAKEMDYRMKQEEKPKVYEKQIKEGRNGFVNAFLITIITTLFGGLCLTYMISSIIETIG